MFNYSGMVKWKERFNTSCKIPGKRKLQSFAPESLSKLEVRTVTNLNNSKVKRIRVIRKDNLLFDNIKGFVTAVYYDEWSLACILETNTNIIPVNLHSNKQKDLTFFSISSKDWYFDNTHIIVDPTITSERTFQLTDKEMKKVCML